MFDENLCLKEYQLPNMFLKKGLLLKNLYSVGIFQNFANVLLKYKSGAFSIQPPVTKADSLSWT